VAEGVKASDLDPDVTFMVDGANVILLQEGRQAADTGQEGVTPDGQQRGA